MGNERGYEYLDLDDLIDLARTLLGDPPPIKDHGLLGAAAGRAAITVSGEDAYPDIWTKASALFQSIVKSHPLVDGNKRLGWLATAVFLEVNGVAITTASNEAVYSFVMEVAAARLSVEAIAARLRNLG